jgi:hypothetical protein
MAVTIYSSGSASIGTTEWSLAIDAAGPTARTDAGVYQAFIDFGAFTFGDEFTLRIYERARSGDTQRLVYSAVITAPLAEPLVTTPPLALMAGWDITLQKSSAASGAVNWSIRKIG